MTPPSASHRPKATRLKRLFEHLLHLGDKMGKIGTLVALPGALLTAVAFSDEIIDGVSKPDITGRVQETIELRCGFEVGGPKQIEAARADFGTWCGNARLAVSFTAILQNNDSIARTLMSVFARVTFDEKIGLAERPLEWRLTRTVEHGIQNYVTSVIERPWQARKIAAGEAQTVELVFWPLDRDEKITFSQLRDLVRSDPSPLEGQSVMIELVGTFSANSAQHQVLARCRGVFESPVLASKRTTPDADFPALVLTCAPRRSQQKS